MAKRQRVRRRPALPTAGSGRRGRGDQKLPGGILAGERGTWRKKWTDRLPVALIFPNTYAVAASNLGWQLVYDLLNEHPAVVAERFVLPVVGARPLSLESGRPLTDFALVCYSLSFEGDSLTLLELLAAGGLTLEAAARDDDHPLVIGGGVGVWLNPEPLAPATDLFILGEAEVALPPVLQFLVAQWPRLGRRLLPRLAADFSACYVPALYHPSYDEQGRLLAMTVQSDAPARVVPALLREPAAGETAMVAGYSRILSPRAEFSDLFLVELGRGCSRNCRFCAAGFIYRPPRLWSPEAIRAALDHCPPAIRRIGLLGMEMAAPETLAAISALIAERGKSLSFSSLRADALTPALLELLAASRIKTAVLAPDGASERLRRIINKGLSEEAVLQAGEKLAAIGVTTLKLYCMLGLPGEEDGDLLELVGMIRRLKRGLLALGRRRGRLTEIQLSVSSFVPKPWTPFQYHPFAGVAELVRRLKLLQGELAGEANVRISAEAPDKAYFQAVVARGDRRLGLALIAMAAGEKRGNWRRQLTGLGVDPSWYASRPRADGEIFPWEIVDPGITARFLAAEYRRALAGKSGQPCRVGACKVCGVCDG
ncbi:MAG TPA: radical SAM protein [Desulfurivibrio alkaliphilus]|uniref:Radical SAM protein n=1 Tax=Desulfurivibrio alkaliphilus TaxID=427923 RepID=A0A7C2TJT9_9BACT|nr:radical SAM protein [Desulfurivibrio alkaliphilus]